MILCFIILLNPVCCYAVSYAESFLCDMGKSIIKIHTTSDNTPAQRLYEKCGYILTDDGVEKITYTKVID